MSARRPRWLLAALALSLSLSLACAQGGLPRTGGSRIEDQVLNSEHQIEREEAALKAAAGQDRPLDCVRAGSLRDNICTLADRICRLVQEDRTIGDGPGRCQRARQRCEDARARVASRCRTG